MKKPAVSRKTRSSLHLPSILLKKKEEKAFLAAARQLEEEYDRLGLLDPMEIEPAVVYAAREERK
jgi:hypothetical protein